MGVKSIAWNPKKNDTTNMRLCRPMSNKQVSH